MTVEYIFISRRPFLLQLLLSNAHDNGQAGANYCINGHAGQLMR